MTALNAEMIRSRFAVMNNAYAAYSFDYFLNSLQRVGICMVDLWGGIQHLNPKSDPVRTIASLRVKLGSRGMSVIAYTPELLAYPFNFAHPDRKIRERSIAYAIRNLDIACGLDAKLMLVSPGWGLLDIPIEESFRYACDSLRTITEAAEARRMRLGLEHLTPQSSNLLIGVDAVKAMLETNRSPWFGAVLDLGQMSVFGESVKDYTTACGERLFHVHVMDGQPACHLAFGDGCLPLKEYIRELTKSGYDGYFTLEINDERYSKCPHEAISRCVEAIREWEV